ncbi:MAG TPA: hypothetical protein VKA60_15960 [Blastocatellia bacterium]|nr:hypothetical protein [Blastocatellia bacterium]
MASTPESPSTSERQLVELRGRISDIGYEIDSAKATSGMLMGGGVFLLLLALLAAYDLLNGKTGIYAPLGITREMLQWIAWGGGAAGAAAIAKAWLGRGRARDREAELTALSEEYARLKEQQATEAE